MHVTLPDYRLTYFFKSIRPSLVTPISSFPAFRHSGILIGLGLRPSTTRPFPMRRIDIGHCGLVQYTVSKHLGVSGWWLTKKAFTGDPFYLSILQNSASLLADFREHRIRFEDYPLLLHHLAGWPDALKIVLADDCPNNTLDSDGWSALDTAIVIGNVASIELLLRSDIQPTEFTWALALRIKSRSEIISKIASWLGEYTQQNPASVLKNYYRPNNTRTPYHEKSMDVEAANALYSAGLVDIDVCALEAYEVFGTPLWVHAFELLYICLGPVLDLLHWFIDKGAQMERAHPIYGTTPLHVIAERSAYILTKRMFRPEETTPDGLRALKRLEKLFHISLHGTVLDMCVCFCATRGCAPFTTALKKIRQAFHEEFNSLYRNREPNLNEIDLKRSVIQHMGLSGILGNKSTQNAIIRVLTFDRLGLTHTCHTHSYSPWGYHSYELLSQGEMSDIHHSEGKDIELLEGLLLDFNAALADHPGTFLEFIDGYWMERMDQIVKDKCTPRKNECEIVFQEVGVVLRPVKEPPQEEIPAVGTFERFIWGVENVMDGCIDVRNLIT